MKMAKAKKDQTYNWALTKMSGPGNIRLSDISKRLWTDELLLAAIKNRHTTLSVLPEHLRTDAIMVDAVKNGCGKLNEIPEELRTEDVCMAAFGYDSSAIHDFPEGIKTGKFYQKLARTYPFSFPYIWLSQRKKENVPQNKFSQDDLDLCIAGLCPTEWFGGSKEGLSADELERKVVSENASGILFNAGGTFPAQLLYLGLKEMRKKFGENENIVF